MESNAKAMNSLFTDLKTEIMIDKKQIITDFDRIIGNNQEVTDDTHMDLVDECADYTETLVNKLFIANVSVSFIEQLKQQIEYHKEQEVNRSKVKDYSQAIYHDNRRGALQDLLLWIKLNER